MSKLKHNGALIISLDFELYWGVHDVITIDDYRANLLGVRTVVPALLKLFDEYRIHATWAIVGFLFCETRDELIRALPERKPHYIDPRLSPYPHIKHIGRNEHEDPFHYAPSLIKLIAASPHQEIGSHTFSHYYCLEKGQDKEAFRADLEAAKKITSRYRTSLESLVFPRNQFNKEYLSVCKDVGITAYRGNERSWMYRAKSKEDESWFRRGVRLADAYIDISGHNCFSPEDLRLELPLNIPSSRFLRPYSKRLRILEPLRLRRILSDLTYAAKNGLFYHLWWHPHNFGADTEENLSFLKKILNHCANMKETYGMESLSMSELARRLTPCRTSRHAGFSADVLELQNAIPTRNP
jgi:peptidoglycan/xylan/chitin deacetylase (PgdA/CDA1 family)